LVKEWRFGENGAELSGESPFIKAAAQSRLFAANFQFIAGNGVTTSAPLFTVRIGEQQYIAEAVTYEAMLRQIMERIIRAAIARSIDMAEWEDEQLRREGLGSLLIFEGSRAIWTEPFLYEDELVAARRLHADELFVKNNVLDPDFYARLDDDLRELWRAAGYEVPSLREDMKRLFAELEKDAARYAEHARQSVVSDILHLLFPENSCNGHAVEQAQ